MKLNIRFILISVFILSVMLSTFFVYAQGNSYEDTIMNESHDNSYNDSELTITIDESIKFSSIINEQFEKLVNYWNGKYPEYYGGAYIDGFTFNILVTCDPKNVEKEIWNITGNNQIKIIQVNNSYYYLQQVNDAIEFSIMQKKINNEKSKDIFSGFGIDEINNNVTLEVIINETAKAFLISEDALSLNNDTINNMKKSILDDLANEVSGYLNENSVNIVFKDEPYIPTSDIIAGTTATTTYNSSISVCGSVKDQNNKTVNGFALCGHVGSLGDTVKIGSTSVGKIQTKAFYSTLDMSFVNIADYPDSGYIRTKK